ncbi:hypothetical protein OHC33_010249 [Knufia fluminis]|uniref:BTB domain-containing protein n=1 Tax=Knufia fluminis TaxID=191047 RepID=A0AAN8I1C2_9EURO|nr:hypothetical protein OHC33_010249 [Knufia fluminis]
MAPTKEQVDGFAGRIEDTTDFTIVLGEYKWRVHSDVVAEASSFFHSIVQGGFKVISRSIPLFLADADATQEENQRVLELHEETPWVFARVLQAIYWGHWKMVHDDDSDICVREHFPVSIDQIMRHSTDASTYQSDKEADLEYWLYDEVPWLDAVINLYRRADYYGVEALRRNCAEQVMDSSSCNTDMNEWWAIWDCFGVDTIRRDIYLQKRFAEELNVDTLGVAGDQWSTRLEGAFAEIPSFGYELFRITRDRGAHWHDQMNQKNSAMLRSQNELASTKRALRGVISGLNRLVGPSAPAASTNVSTVAGIPPFLLPSTFPAVSAPAAGPSQGHGGNQ